MMITLRRYTKIRKNGDMSKRFEAAMLITLLVCRECSAAVSCIDSGAAWSGSGSGERKRRLRDEDSAVGLR